jgi:hypothetical protein
MQAISFLTNWINYLFIIIPAGAAAMVTYQASRKSLSDDAETIADADSKIKQTIKGAIIGLSLSGLIAILKSFYM